MSQFQKRPIRVEAREFVRGAYKSVAAWCGGTLVYGDRGAIAWLSVKTPEGRMKAEIGDWIVQGIKGEFYPVKPDIFEATYEDPLHANAKLHALLRAARDVIEEETRTAFNSYANLTLPKKERWSDPGWRARWEADASGSAIRRLDEAIKAVVEGQQS